jgi:hypothetical protein
MRIWNPERNAAQGVMVAEMYQRAGGVPCERSAILAGGLRGADLAHAEAQFVAKRLLLRALSDGRNLICDMTMASPRAVESWLVALVAGDYTTRAVFVDISVEESVRRSDALHRAGCEEYLSGRGYGGRYVPAETIRALADVPAETGDQAGAAPAGLRTGAVYACVGVDGGAVTRLLELYWRGGLELGALGREFQARRWPEALPACPAFMKDAAAAIDDPEPYLPGSFDDVVRAYDLGLLSDDEYAFLADAAVAERHSRRI